jgi:hypothetical protein
MRNVQAWIEVMGADTETYSVRLCAQVGLPAHFAEPDGAAYVRIQAPRDVPVTISGQSPISVYGMSAPAKVSTTHARLTVADTTGDVEAAVTYSPG